jgi:hypothetical protein
MRTRVSKMHPLGRRTIEDKKKYNENKKREKKHVKLPTNKRNVIINYNKKKLPRREKNS